MRILVTGASGFIGRAVVKRLLQAEEHELICVSRTATEFGPGIQTVHCDLQEIGWTRNLTGPIDVVLHLAQSRLYRKFPEGAGDMVRVNIDATAELLEWARQKGCARFLAASTGNVYRPEQRPLQESDPCEPISLYGATKLAAELLVRCYADYFGVTIMRVFGVYGPGQKEMLIPGIISRIQRGEEVRLAQGHGLFLTLLYIDDCVEVICRLLSQPLASGLTVMNVAGNDRLSVGEMAEVIGARLGLEPLKRITSDPPIYLEGDNTRMRELVGYRPQTSFAQGIDAVVASLSA